MLPFVPAWWESEYLSTDDQKLLWEEVNTLPFQLCRVEGRQQLSRETVVLATRELKSIPIYWGEGVKICPFGFHANALRVKLKREWNCDFDVCLLNRYCDGKQNIAWHADKEEQGITRCIASISLGAERTLEFLAKDSGERTAVKLKPGSLLVMIDPCQQTHLHRIPSEKSCFEPRINMTFRMFH